MSNPDPVPLSPADDLFAQQGTIFKRPVSPWPSPWEQRNGIVPQASDDWRHARPAGSPDVATVQQQRRAAQARVARWQALLSDGHHEVMREKYAEATEPPEWFE